MPTFPAAAASWGANHAACRGSIVCEHGLACTRSRSLHKERRYWPTCANSAKPIKSKTGDRPRFSINQGQTPVRCSLADRGREATRCRSAHRPRCKTGPKLIQIKTGVRPRFSRNGGLTPFCVCLPNCGVDATPCWSPRWPRYAIRAKLMKGKTGVRPRFSRNGGLTPVVPFDPGCSVRVGMVSSLPL
jgi:hypothetical protein